MQDAWIVRRRGMDERTAAPEESLFSLGNGYIGWRGNYEEGTSRPMGVEGCYINGFHETEKIRYGEIAYGYAQESQTMLNVTSSQRILLSLGDRALHPDQARDSVRTLLLREGLLQRETVYEAPGGSLTVKGTRLVSFPHPHMAAIRMELTADVPCTVFATALLDGDVTNLVCTDDPRVGSGLHGRHLGVHDRRLRRYAASRRSGFLRPHSARPAEGLRLPRHGAGPSPAGSRGSGGPCLHAGGGPAHHHHRPGPAADPDPIGGTLPRRARRRARSPRACGPTPGFSPSGPAPACP